jgi:hypothetical protein
MCRHRERQAGSDKRRSKHIDDLSFRRRLPFIAGIIAYTVRIELRQSVGLIDERR